MCLRCDNKQYTGPGGDKFCRDCGRDIFGKSVKFGDKLKVPKSREYDQAVFIKVADGINDNKVVVVAVNTFYTGCTRSDHIKTFDYDKVDVTDGWNPGGRQNG